MRIVLQMEIRLTKRSSHARSFGGNKAFSWTSASSLRFLVHPHIIIPDYNSLWLSWKLQRVCNLLFLVELGQIIGEGSKDKWDFPYLTMGQWPWCSGGQLQENEWYPQAVLRVVRNRSLRGEAIAPWFNSEMYEIYPFYWQLYRRKMTFNRWGYTL